MNKPRHMERLFALILLCLGAVFIITGLLCFLGIIKPTANSSVQDPIVMGIAFGALGVALCLAQTVLIIINNLKEKLHKELLASGNKIIGTVEKVYLQKYTHFGKKSPFRICYTFTMQDKIFHHKSRLIWDKPDFKEGDSIVVFASNLGKSTIQI